MPRPLDPTEDWLWRGIKVFFKGLAWVGYRTEVTGLDVFESIGRNEGVIVAANHQSLCDAYLLAIYTPKKVHFLGRRETLWSSRKVSWINDFFGTIPVDTRKNDAAILAGLKVLREKKALGIFPEGAIRHKRKSYGGKTGVARLALRGKAKVIPAGIIGTIGKMPWGAEWPEAGRKLHLHFGEPIDFSEHYGEVKERMDKELLHSVTHRVMRETRRLSSGYAVPIEEIPQLKQKGAWY